ncbi:DUF349 domain-containing protein [Knoellia aerolata]|uniref:ATPase n=1 Tax=Knoellia aerolata DSM 18566 TaxID=1385519 RepID=A0A0A0JWY8_9MICO|nr:DUF349 domain-containing protein [Knoellia aerolata]KGN41224.1 hypothetical protein N801_02140 [Knoellia aerolata DSM 18566]
MSDQTTSNTSPDETMEVPAEEFTAATEVTAGVESPSPSDETTTEPAAAEPATEPEPAASVETATEPEPGASVETASEPELGTAEPASETQPELAAPEPATEPEPSAAPAAETSTDEVAPVEAPAETPAEVETASEEPAPAAAPAAPSPRPAVPSPAALASRMAARPAPPVAAPVHQHSESARFGRVDDEGHVFVTVGEEEREVGSYPGAGPDEALQYFARKYDEIAASADLLQQRLGNPDVPAKEIAEGLATLKEHVAEAKVVGDLAALDSTVAAIEAGLSTKRESEQAARAEARVAAAAEREAIVAEAESIAAQNPEQTQWKQSGERMRTLLDQWKGHQRAGVKLDKPTETSLWQRFSHARNHFDKGRRTYFAQLDSSRADARTAKEALVREAEALSTSKDWGPTARAFKNLMDQWRQAGRASRAEDDALWERFKAAQDAFFNAKDEVSAAEEEEFRANLAVKEGLMVEAEKILPVTDLESAKSALRVIQDKWDAAGKVPRADIERTEKVMRRVETAVREVEDKKWKSSNPEVAARANSMVTQLRSSIETIEADLAKATAAGNDKKVKDLTARLESQQVWLRQAEAANDEFGA